MDEIPEICRRLKKARTKGELLDLLFHEVTKYSLYDLQYVRADIEYEIRHLPVKYRKALLPKTMEQIFGAHHSLLVLYRKGMSAHKDEKPDEKFPEFCDMMQMNSGASRDHNPRYTLLYYLLSAYTMFILGMPGHPVGTPFPGGMVVEERNGTYYCPVREKADDVETSICPYCVAKQS